MFTFLQMDLLQRLSPKIGYMLNDPTNPQRYQENLVKLEIYYEEFNFEEVTEMPSYPVSTRSYSLTVVWFPRNWKAPEVYHRLVIL